MNEYNTIVTLQDYGKIKIKLNEVIQAKRITRNKLATLTNVRFEVIDHLYSGNLERLDLDIMARICFVLECKVSDILEFVKE
jgi:putative transcriptional regulator